MKQVYPPPDQEEEPADGPRGTNAPLRNAKSPRGPLMRPADAPPVPKGKVRQLYPPPPFDATVDSDPDRRERDTANLEAFDDDAEPAFEAPSSLFVSDSEELEERRQRARDRAEARRRGEPELPPGDDAPLEKPERMPVDDQPGSDEWPAF